MTFPTLSETTDPTLSAVLTPRDPGYDEARALWNAAVDARPAVLARPAKAGGVAHALRLARELDLRVAVRGGGHGLAGLGTVEGGLVIDLSRLRGVDVDPGRRVVRVGGGATWGEVAAALHPHGLALTSGDASGVGVGGLTLHGGIGWMARRHGLTIDRLRAVDLVTADGETLRASATEESELFWALRGGGGGLGVATAFEFDAHEGGTVLGGAVLYDATDPARAAALLGAYAELALAAPEGLTTQALLLAAPPAPFVPASHVGKPTLVVMLCHVGDLDEGERAAAPLRRLGPPLADLVAPLPYPAMFGLKDAGVPRGLRHFPRAMFLDVFDDRDADALARAALGTLRPGSIVQLRALRGAVARVPSGATAFAHRSRAFLLQVGHASPDARHDAACQADSDRVWNALAHRALGLPAAFAGPAERDRARDVFPPDALARLEAARRRVDPRGVFVRADAGR